MVEWTTETCRREMLINQNIAFGFCVCMDWITTDQLAQRGVAGQIICKLRNDFRTARTPADCAVTRSAAGQCHSDLCYTPQRSLYNIQYLSRAVDLVLQNSHCPKETSSFPIKSANPSQCGRCSPLHIRLLCFRKPQWCCVWALLTDNTDLSTQVQHWQRLMLIKWVLQKVCRGSWTITPLILNLGIRWK